jgi:predicted transcriptional regulator
MRLFWQHGPMTVRLVHRRIAAQRDLAYATVMTTMERLVAKGLLQRGSRQGLGGAYSDTPATSEQAFVAERLADILGAIERDYPAALASYLDTRQTAPIVGPTPDRCSSWRETRDRAPLDLVLERRAGAWQ